MTDPENENTDNKRQENEEETSSENNGGNQSGNPPWNEHMQIDEEGNEVSPDDQ